MIRICFFDFASQLFSGNDTYYFCSAYIGLLHPTLLLYDALRRQGPLAQHAGARSSSSSAIDREGTAALLAVRVYIEGNLVPVRAGGLAGTGEAGGHRAVQRAAVQAHCEVHREHERDRGRCDYG